jgi:hypothetical protein
MSSFTHAKKIVSSSSTVAMPSYPVNPTNIIAPRSNPPRMIYDRYPIY